jgi:hypothetical protein
VDGIYLAKDWISGGLLYEEVMKS